MVCTVVNMVGSNTGGLISVGYAYIWNGLSVSKYGGLMPGEWLIFEGLIVGGLRYYAAFGSLWNRINGVYKKT